MRHFFFSKKIPQFCLGVLAFSMATNALAEYDVLKRVKLIDDRMGLMQNLRPYGHDFYFDINLGVTPDLTKLVDDVKGLGDLKTDEAHLQESLDEVNLKLQSHYNTEQVISAKLDLGFPIFSFTAGTVKVRPNFRVGGGMTALLHPYKSKLKITDVINNLDQIPADLRATISSCLDGLSYGDDIIKKCLTPMQAAMVEAAYGIKTFPFIYDDVVTEKEIPAFDLYAKIDAYARLVLDYEILNDHWFGFLTLGTQARFDVKKNIDASLLLGGAAKDTFEVRENQRVALVGSYQLGYRNDNYTAALSVEELPITNIAEGEEGVLNYDLDPLVRLHAQATYKLWLLTVDPFLGTHMRSGYGAGDAYYVGADWGMHFWKERLGLTFKTMLDKEHATLGLRTKLWFTHLDLTAKLPVAKEVDSVKVPSYYMANFRLFF